MKNMIGSALSKKIVNIIGGTAYVTCLMQWLWMLLVFLPAIIASPFFKMFLSSDQPPVQHIVQVQSSTSPLSPIVAFGGVALGITIVAVGFYTLIVKIPKNVTRTGEKITHAPVNVIVPTIVKHSHISPAQKKLLPETVIIVIKLLITFIPLYLLTLASSQPIHISFTLVMLIGITLFSWTFFMFALQLLLSRFFKVDYKTIR